MILSVENGEGLPNSNSYISLTDIENYLPSTIKEKWDLLSDDEKNDRLIIASMFIDYSFNWIGQRKTLEQGLNFPRKNIVFQGHEIPDNYIPAQVKKACAMAVNLLINCGIDFFQETGEAQVKKEKLGAMETEYFEALKSQFDYNTQFNDLNNILRGFYNMPSKGVITAEVLRK